MAWALAVALVGAAVTAWSGIPAAGQVAATLRTPLSGEPATLDPYFAVDSSSGPLVSLMYSTLVAFDSRGRLVPAGARSWEISPNGLIYTFHLRDNIKFHGGRRVTAADWKWSFERMGDPSLKALVADVVLSGVTGYEAYQKGAPGIAGLRAVDPLTLQLVLNPAHRGGFLNRLAYYAAVVLDREVVEKGGKEWFATRDAGSGPFVLREWVHNSRIALAGDPNFYQGAPSVTHLELPIVTEASTQLSEYIAGQLDLIQVPLGDFQRIKSDPVLGKQMFVAPRAQILFLGLNPRVYEPFKDARVRRAIALAIDRGKIAQTVFFGFFRPANSIVPPGIPGFYADFKGLPYDPAAAKTLLEEAGVAGKLPPLRIAMNPFTPVSQMAAEPIAAMLKANLGLDAQLEKTEFATFVASLNKRTVYQSFLTGWSADYLDYSDYLDLLLDSRSALDRTSYSNPEFDRLIDQANAAPSEAQRIEIYHKAEALAVQDAPMVPLFFPQFAMLKKPYVAGLATTPMLSGWLPFSGVSIQK
jgi:oligopeptide transport system substrate-binding protein